MDFLLGLGFLTMAINLVAVVFAAIGFFDAMRRTDAEFEMVGRGQKVAWLIGLALSAGVLFFNGMFSFFGIFATVATIVYHVELKPKLNGRIF